MSAVKVARMRRDNPAFDRMVRDVETIRSQQTGAHLVARCDPETGRVSFRLHVRDGRLNQFRRALGGVAFTSLAGAWHFQGGRRHMDVLLTNRRSLR